MKKQHLLMMLFPALVFASYLAIVNQQAALAFFGLLIVFSWFIYLSTQTKNNVLITAISLVAIANVIGTPLFILNEPQYSYSGWNAVKDFDFSTIYFLSIYAYSFPSILLLIGFTWLIEKCIPRQPLVTHKVTGTKFANSSIGLNAYKEIKNKPRWTFLFLILMILTVAMAIFMYLNKIAVLGIEPEPLPYKIVGILFYLRGYVLPITLFLVFTKTSQSALLMMLTIVMALIVGGLSASRGITFVYMFPVLAAILLYKISLQRIALVIALILLGYVTTTMFRELIYADQSSSVIDLLMGLLSSESEFQSDEGLIVSMLSIISTISNRLYGAQDMILAYQHVLIDPWSSFGNFLFTEPIVNDPAKELYGLEFLPGQGYGVGMGLVGIFVMIGRSDFALLAIAILLFSLLIVIMNRLLTRLFFEEQSGKYFQLYYLILFIAAFNVIQATLQYLYSIIILSYGLIILNYVHGHFLPRRKIKMRINNG